MSKLVGMTDGQFWKSIRLLLDPGNPDNCVYRVLKPLTVFKKLNTGQREFGYRTSGYNVICELRIPAQALVVIPRGCFEKMRASSAEVVALTARNGVKVKVAYNCLKRHLKYEVGHKVYPHKLDKTNEECGAGINFFLRKQRAIEF